MRYSWYSSPINASTAIEQDRETLCQQRHCIAIDPANIQLTSKAAVLELTELNLLPLSLISGLEEGANANITGGLGLIVLAADGQLKETHGKEDLDGCQRALSKDLRESRERAGVAEHRVREVVEALNDHTKNSKLGNSACETCSLAFGNIFEMEYCRGSIPCLSSITR